MTDPENRRPSGGRTLVRISLIGGAVASLWHVSLVFNQRSSTAAIGIIDTPFVFVLAAALVGLYAWGVFQTLRRPPWRKPGLRSWASWLIALSVIGSITPRVATVAGRISAFYRLSSPRANPERLERAVDRLLDRKDYFILSAIARNPKTPPAALLAIAQADDPGLHEKRHGPIQLFDRDGLAVVRKILRNPSMPIEALPLLARSSNAYVLGDLAGHKLATEPLLREIAAKSDSYLVLWGLARNPSTPSDILEQVSAADVGASWVLASNLAGNPSTPAPILERLADHEHKQVRSALAHNPALPRATMLQLAGDPDEQVRLSLITNQAIDLEVVEIMTLDSSKAVVRYADWAYQKIGKSPATSPSTLARLASHPDRNVRRYAGLSPNIDRALMEQLAADPDSRVRYYLASNPAVDRDVMQRLSEDTNNSVRTTAGGTLHLTRPVATVPSEQDGS